ncbi:MAG: hypothetical protein OCD01_07940 [Fibrobacterales bacterium]
MKQLLMILMLTATMVMAQGLGNSKGKGYGDGGGKKYECPRGDKECKRMAKGPKFNRLFKKLGLDQSTQEQVKVILSAHHKQIALLKLESEEHKIVLKKMILRDKFDMDLITKNCNKRGDIWAQIHIKQFEKDAKIKELLTKEQWDTYIMHRLSDKGKRGKHGKQGKSWNK